jgi:hypothetical protein
MFGVHSDSALIDWLEPYDKKMSEGEVAEALVIGMKGAQMGPLIFNKIPNGIMELTTNLQMSLENKFAPAYYIKWEELAPTLLMMGC